MSLYIFTLCTVELFPKVVFFNDKTSPSFSYLGFKMTMDVKIHGVSFFITISVVGNKIGNALRAARLLKLPVQRLHILTETLSKQFSCMLFIPPLSFSFLC